MHWPYIFFGMVPAVVFAVLEKRTTIRNVAGATVAVAAVEFVINSIAIRLFDPFSFASLALFAGLGFWAVRRDDPRHLRLQPIFLEAAIALLFFVAVFGFEVPLLRNLLEFVGLLETIPAYQRGHFANDLDTLSRSMPFLLLAHAGLLTLLARRESNAAWIWMRTVGLLVMLAALFLGERLFIEPV